MDGQIKELDVGAKLINEFADSLSLSAHQMFLRMKGKGFWEKMQPIAECYAEAYLTDTEFESLRAAIISEKLMLITGELSEAQEALRKNAKDDKLPQHDGLPVEIIDAVIRCQDLLGFLAKEFGYDIGQMYLDKVNYNATRPHKHGKGF